jgi:excisionase family DNA binding protein
LWITFELRTVHSRAHSASNSKTSRQAFPEVELRRHVRAASVPTKIPLTPIAVSPVDAARIAGVSRSRIYELIKAGELPAYKDGARTLILVADIEAWLARLKPVPPPTGLTEPTGPLLPLEARKLARRRALDSIERRRTRAKPVRVRAPAPEPEPVPELLASEPPALESAFESTLAPEPEPEPEPWVHE